MKLRVLVILGLLVVSGAGTWAAEERLELDSIYVKGSKEFPQALYVVPWKDVKGRERKDQALVLHSLYGDLFDPVYMVDTADGDDRRRR